MWSQEESVAPVQFFDVVAGSPGFDMTRTQVMEFTDSSNTAVILVKPDIVLEEALAGTCIHKLLSLGCRDVDPTNESFESGTCKSTSSSDTRVNWLPISD